ncbi:MAG: hypothetical protein DSZ03_08935 [Sulfurimonas sp.]|nr:MAG: hypothetical protein DSZ03_08935 [Sulfurimonas sp.]
MYQESARTLKSVIQDAPYFDAYSDFQKYTMKTSGLQGRLYFKSLRLLLTGAEHGPEISDIYRHLKNYLAEVVK